MAENQVDVLPGRESRRAPAWLIGGGECGRLIAAFDWSRTSVGPIDDWSAELRTTVANMLNSPVAMVVMWGDDHIMIYNDSYSEIAGLNHPRALGGSVEGVWPEVWDWNRRVLQAGMRGEATAFHEQALVLHRSGEPETLTFDLFYAPVYGPGARVAGVACTCFDVSGRAAVQRDLRASDKRFRTAMDAIHGVLWTNSADGKMLGEQPAWGTLTGQTVEQYQGFGWAEAVHPEDAPPTIEAWNKAVATRSTFEFEHRVRNRHGAWRVFAVRAMPRLGPDGGIEEWVGVHTDITHQRAAEAALRDQAAKLARQVQHRERAEAQLRQLNETLETRVATEIEERRRAEAKLLQAQKMETIGKLTGGVAHDFNNLLQVVSGNLQLLSRDVAGEPRAERRVANAMAGVTRGARLASQLLAFGRRQPLEPRAVNLTRVVRGMDDMLRRAIGEGIEIETVVGGGLWNTLVDPTQIENALLNLAINARDAMNGQGRLTIEVGNASLDAAYARAHDDVAPGQYVVLAVTDTGSGMSADVMEQVFEPFFSTKGEGKGSGLGLSMVYGFVKQSGGHIKLYSEVGEGTTVRLYLPRAMQSEDAEVVVDDGPVCGGSETILVVEDDAEVRATVVEMLGELGYRILRATDAQSALVVVESGAAIDLLFTDVVMPGALKSPELARKARERLPDLAVLFTSGYTENAIVHGGRLDAGVELLSKPYTREALARRIRHLLSNQKQRQAAAAPSPASRPSPPAVGEPAAKASDGRDAAGIGGVLLMVEDDPLIRASTAEQLREEGWDVREAAGVADARAILAQGPVEVVVTDINLPDGSGLDLVHTARAFQAGVALVIATGDPGAAAGSNPDGVQMLAKPYDTDRLLAAVLTAIRTRPVTP